MDFVSQQKKKSVSIYAFLSLFGRVIMYLFLDFLQREENTTFPTDSNEQKSINDTWFVNATKKAASTQVTIQSVHFFGNNHWFSINKCPFDAQRTNTRKWTSKACRLHKINTAKGTVQLIQQLSKTLSVSVCF